MYGYGMGPPAIRDPGSAKPAEDLAKGEIEKGRQASYSGWPTECDQHSRKDEAGVFIDVPKPEIRARIDGVAWYLCTDCYLNTRHENGDRVFEVADPKGDVDLLLARQE